MTTRVCRPKTTPTYPDPPVVHNISAKTFAATRLHSGVTQTPLPGGSTGGVHWGYDITQDNMEYPPKGFYPTAQNATARAALASVPNAMITCHIGNFGVFPPETSNGVYDWGGEIRGVPLNGLDDGVALVRDMTGPTGINAIILCTCPGWMKASGQDFSMDEAPTDANEGNFAALCADIVARYTDVQYFIFWNEFKGLYNSQLNRWNYEKYTRMYNLAWNAMKAVRPSIKMGGPYPVSQSHAAGYSSAPATTLGDPGCTFTGGAIDGRDLDVFSYFRDHANGWDFLACDIWVGNRHPLNAGVPVYPLTPGFTNLQQLDKFPKQLQWFREHIEPVKPIIIAEAYPCTGPTAQVQAEDLLISCFQRIRDEVDVQQGIWFLQWGEQREPPNPINYSTGAATGLIAKLQAWEASQ